MGEEFFSSLFSSWGKNSFLTPSPFKGEGWDGGNQKEQPMQNKKIKLQKHATSLRKHQTDAEQALWHHLRRRQLYGIKFRRQYILEHYIVDFVALDLKLIIEVDGAQHQEQKRYDKQRTLVLQSLGFKVLRYWNNEVLGNREGVLQAIYLEIAELLGILL